MILLLSFLHLLSLIPDGGNVRGKIMTIIDGNTVELLTETDETMTIVFMDIDCPELTQAYGEEAKDFAAKLLHHQQVVVRVYGKDRLKNYLGVVLLKNETDIRPDLLAAGLAWTAEKNPVRELEHLQTVALQNKKGLWKQEHPVPPWIFRREQSMSEPKSR
jgi:micrococcal nuclease